MSVPRPRKTWPNNLDLITYSDVYLLEYLVQLHRMKNRVSNLLWIAKIILVYMDARGSMPNSAVLHPLALRFTLKLIQGTGIYQHICGEQ